MVKKNKRKPKQGQSSEDNFLIDLEEIGKFLSYKDEISFLNNAIGTTFENFESFLISYRSMKIPSSEIKTTVTSNFLQYLPTDKFLPTLVTDQGPLTKGSINSFEELESVLKSTKEENIEYFGNDENKKQTFFTILKNQPFIYQELVSSHNHILELAYKSCEEAISKFRKFSEQKNFKKWIETTQIILDYIHSKEEKESFDMKSTNVNKSKQLDIYTRSKSDQIKLIDIDKEGYFETITSINLISRQVLKYIEQWTKTLESLTLILNSDFPFSVDESACVDGLFKQIVDFVLKNKV